jgi:hypothetical protein
MTLTANAVAWVTRELARRIGGLPVPLRYERLASADDPCVVVPPTDETDWDAVLRRAAAARCEIRGRALVVDADVVAATYFLLSRLEEVDSTSLDEHGRFPSTASAAHRLGLLDRPLVDEWAMAIRDGLRTLLPAWTPGASRFEVRLTHDVDTLRAFHGVARGVRTVVGDVVRRGDVARAVADAAATLRQAVAPSTSANWRGAIELARLSRDHGLRSAFYFMAAPPLPPDGDYDVASAEVRRLIEELRTFDVELGIHPGYATLGDPARLAAEKARLDAVLGTTRYGARRHWLRFRVPDTWRESAAVGLTHDATLGFADREGFRCGTCRPFRPFDVAADREIDILEVPLVAMDATLRKHRGLSPDATDARLRELAEICRRVDGTFTLLWHNSSLDGPWKPWGDVYRRLVPWLASMDGSVASSAPRRIGGPSQGAP